MTSPQRPAATRDAPTPKLGRASTAPAGHGLSIGDRLANGRYQVTGVLGTGGMSMVYDAFDRVLERSVALKVLRDDVAAAALLDEARVLAAASHPAVVAVYALHLDANPPFLVMEHVDGVSLDRMLSEGAPPSWSDKWRFLRSVAEALDHLHERGITHGDVKPANVLVTSSGQAKLADFGVTTLLRRADPGQVVGTPAYMSPERARGIAVNDASLARGDVYSFAVLAYVMLAGRPPFVGQDPHALLRAQATEEPPLLSAVSDRSASFDRPLARALAKNPLVRPARASELMAELDTAARGLDADGRPYRLLVVDDDDAHRRLHALVRERSLPAAIIETAADGEDALAKIIAQPPTVLVADLAMPGVSGLMLIEQVLARSPRTGVVVVTGQGSGPERTAAVALGVGHFLIKPCEAEELTRCVLACADARAT